MSNTTTKWILELIDRVSQPLKKIDRLAKLSSRSIGGVDRMLERINRKSSVLTKRLRGMSIAAVAFGALAIGSVQFEQGMARANTMAGLGAIEMSKVTEQIRNIAEIAPIARQQLSEGLFNTISAGVPKDNWISFLRDSSKASVAGNAELGVVVDATASVIKAYGDTWENTIKVQDRFQKTVQLGQIPSLQSLASAIPRVSAVSAKLKISQEELLSVFATASGVMGRPAEVGTQLNAVLNALLKPGAEAAKMAKNLGIAFNSASIGKAGGLKNYIDVLMPKIKAFSDRTGTTQEEIIGRLFGSQEAIKLVIGLGGNLAESWADNTLKIANSTGSVQSAFDIMSVTTTSKLQIMRNNFGNAMDGIFVILAPLFQVLIGGITHIFHFISAFTQSHPVLAKFVIIGSAVLFSIVFISTALSLLSLKLSTIYLKLIKASLGSNRFASAMAKAALKGMGFLKTMVRMSIQLARQVVGYALVGAQMLGAFLIGLVSATGAQWALNIAMNSNPIGLIVIGIVAAIGAIVLLVKYWDEIKKAVWNFTKFMWKISPFKFLIDLVEKIFPGFKQGLKNLFSKVIDFALKFWDKIKAIFGKIKAFFGFEDNKATVDVKVTKNANGKEIPITNAQSDLLFKPTTTQAQTGGISGVGGSGGVGGGKSITMNLDIKNIFNVTGGQLKGKIDDIADEIVGKINDRMRDAAIALG